ncbi:Uncharacterised protein [Shigella sonnei]|nr:Uncharacterised protein [Shigella sonnei]
MPICLTAITFQLQIIGEVAHFDKTYVTIFQTWLFTAQFSAVNFTRFSH